MKNIEENKEKYDFDQFEKQSHPYTLFNNEDIEKIKDSECLALYGFILFKGVLSTFEVKDQFGWEAKKTYSIFSKLLKYDLKELK